MMTTKQIWMKIEDRNAMLRDNFAENSCKTSGWIQIISLFLSLLALSLLRFEPNLSSNNGKTRPTKQKLCRCCRSTNDKQHMRFSIWTCCTYRTFHTNEWKILHTKTILKPFSQNNKWQSLCIMKREREWVLGNCFEVFSFVISRWLKVAMFNMAANPVDEIIKTATGRECV